MAKALPHFYVDRTWSHGFAVSTTYVPLWRLTGRILSVPGVLRIDAKSHYIDVVTHPEWYTWEVMYQVASSITKGVPMAEAFVEELDYIFPRV